MNQIITLLSDWRLRDPYVAMLKGELWKAQPDAQILDITHYVDKFNLPQTALLMKTSYITLNTRRCSSHVQAAHQKRNRTE